MDSVDVTLENLHEVLSQDTGVKVAGIDVDGILRGKIVSKKKFLSIAKDGFGFCSVIFGWDMHDTMYEKELSISNKENGYRDLLAIIDLKSFRRIPFENNIPFFYCFFYDPITNKPIAPCPRSLLKSIVDKLLKESSWAAMAGAEFEFYHYKESPNSVKEKGGKNLVPLTPGMFGYSLNRPALNKDYYYDIWNTSNRFGLDVEGWHTETGPGVYEAALTYTDALKMADRAVLFKFTCKAVAAKYGIMPCFMAKPASGLPGNSGHLHVSLIDSITGENIFARKAEDINAKWPDIAWLSDHGRHFLAGVLAGLPDIMPLLAPTINSYKRLVENFWAPVTVSWGLEHRIASIRLITPPTASKKATRFEIRTPGADVETHLALAAIFSLGLMGIKEKLELSIPPMGTSSPSEFKRLPKNLRTATERFMKKDSLARKILGDDFVEHYGATRLHECDAWDDAVTDWEVSRYLEIV